MKHKKPFIIESRFLPNYWGGFSWAHTWHKWKRYNTEKKRQQAFAALRQSHKDMMEFRLKAG